VSPAAADGPNAAGTRAVKRRRLRFLVIVLAALEGVLLIAFIGLMATVMFSSDPLGRAIGQGMATLAAIPLIGFALPALTLGVLDRWLALALLLAALAVPVAMVLFIYA
jgi:hypothetical protein